MRENKKNQCYESFEINNLFISVNHFRNIENKTWIHLFATCFELREQKKVETYFKSCIFLFLYDLTIRIIHIAFSMRVSRISSPIKQKDFLTLNIAIINFHFEHQPANRWTGV